MTDTGGHVIPDALLNVVQELHKLGVPLNVDGTYHVIVPPETELEAQLRQSIEALRDPREGTPPWFTGWEH